MKIVKSSFAENLKNLLNQDFTGHQNSKRSHQENEAQNLQQKSVLNEDYDMLAIGSQITSLSKNDSRLLLPIKDPRKEALNAIEFKEKQA